MDWRPSGPSQGTVEAATLCVLLHEYDLFKLYDKQEQQRIFDWLSHITRIDSFASNWRVFNLTIECFLSMYCRYSYNRRHVEVINRLYVGGGYYRDGEHGSIDFYNAWVFHYYLPIIAKWNVLNDQTAIDIVDRRMTFLRHYPKDFFTSKGMKSMGRSLYYTTACLAPFFTGQVENKEIALETIRNVLTYSRSTTSSDAYGNAASWMWCFKPFYALKSNSVWDDNTLSK